MIARKTATLVHESVYLLDLYAGEYIAHPDGTPITRTLAGVGDLPVVFPNKKEAAEYIERQKVNA